MQNFLCNQTPQSLPPMPKMQLPHPLFPPSLLSPSTRTFKTLRFLCNSSFHSSSQPMAGKTHSQSPNQDNSNDPKLPNYPTPLSPPLPAISKQIELNRAMTASSKSSLFSLSESDIVFEDEWLVVVNKPQGVYCENVLSSMHSRFGINSTDSTIPLAPTKPLEFHLANRLDRDTSGIMVITKSNKVAGKLVKAFTDHMVQKTYIALSIGLAPKWKKISIKSGHGRSKFGVWRVYAASDVGRTLPGGSVVRDMATTFEVLSINRKGSFREPTSTTPSEEEFLIVEKQGVPDGDKNDEILVRAYPRSGRTHQIRLHSQYLGIPIRGDVKYEGVYDWGGRTYDGHALHAESLSLKHPVTDVRVEFRAPLPLWASEIVQSFKEKNMICEFGV